MLELLCFHVKPPGRFDVSYKSIPPLIVLIIMPLFQIRQCTRPECRFRYPVVLEPEGWQKPHTLCPRCGAGTQLVGETFSNEKTGARLPEAHPFEVEALLDNIRSTYNVGSIFRTADGAGMRHLHLCGVTPTPENPKIRKTALGAEDAVTWSYSRNALDTALSLKAAGMHLWALESCSRAVSLFSGRDTLPVKPILLVVGNELSGVDPGILDVCDQVVAIPMQGHKQSLNVAIAFGIAAYYLRFGLPVNRYN
jgi:23S rRNA (guanosine2251-2'-O)-methyltransferase